jgi:hypothetical protein
MAWLKVGKILTDECVFGASLCCSETKVLRVGIM